MVLIFNSTVSREIFGTNFTTVRLSGNRIARGEAECYLPLNLTLVKFIPNFTPTRAITYTYMYIYMWRYVKLYAHARWYVMWAGLSVTTFISIVTTSNEH